MTRAARAVISCVLLASGWAVGACTEGELRLLDATGDRGGAGSGASTHSGGTGASSGTGASVSEGGTCSGGGCSVCAEGGSESKSECEPQCPDSQSSNCRPCESAQDCPASVPVCSPVSQMCVQCVSGEDCISLFGGVKPLCWAGECTSCQVDGDCPFGLACSDGVCGRCAGDLDCPSGLTCKNETCAPS